jgi:hypothetical protein
MADTHCTSLDEAIREGKLSPWLALPFALGWIIYAAIAIPVALIAAGVRRINPLPKHASERAAVATAARRAATAGGAR